MPETAAIGTFLVLHGLAVMLWAPAYLKLLRLLAGPYTQFLYDPFWHVLLTGPWALLTCFALLAFAALRRGAKHPALLSSFALGSVVCLVAGAAQQKGLSYHLYPSLALATLLLGVLAFDVGDLPRTWVVRAYRVLAVSVLATLALAVCVRNLAAAMRSGPTAGQEQFERLAGIVRAHSAGEGVYVLSYHIGSAYPLINYAGAHSASRFPQLWIFPAAYMDQLKSGQPLRYHAADEMSPSERYLNQAVFEDLRNQRPKLLLVLQHARDLPVNGFRRLDYVAYFGRDPRIGSMFDQYQLIADVGDMDVYERIPAGSVRSGPPPSVQPATRDILRPVQGGLLVRVGDPGFLLMLLAFVVSAVLASTSEKLRPVETIAPR